MQILLIRHGSTPGNLEHRYVGTTNEELTEEAVQNLRLNRGRYPVPNHVFVSPLKRCIQTAQILFPEQSGEEIADLRECEFGAFEYKNYLELQGDPDYQAWIDSNGTLPFPNGEGREQFITRCCRAFSVCIDRCSEENTIAFVVHGGTIMAILDQYSAPHKDYFDWQVKNARGFLANLAREENRIRLKNIIPIPDQSRLIGIEDQFVMKKNQKLRCGYTTGSCASAAAQAAARMLLGQKRVDYAGLRTPKQIDLQLPIVEQKFDRNMAVCAVRKYGGDDPDATDGALIYAKAELVSEQELEIPAGNLPDARVWIDGGTGVGRVTKPGLEQPVGAAAINRVPREMIAREVQAVCEDFEYEGKIQITISVPAGVEIGKRTFNPHIGILGGISILGTSGIVVPMSEEALIASIRLEMKQKKENGEKYLLITPGNYGADFIRNKERSEALDAKYSMKCSNYVGETLDMAVELGVTGILFVAHIGKFIKVSGGIMNTHSAHADCRAELMAAQAMRAGAEPEIVKKLLATNTTEEAVGILKEENLLSQTIKEIAGRIRFHLQKRCRGALETEVILFSNQFGYLGETDCAEAMMEKVIAQKK